MGLRLALPCVLLTVLILLIAAADTHGGTYVVRECHKSAPQNLSHEARSERLPDPGAYTVSASSSVCGQSANEFALRIFPTNGALSDQYGRVRFQAPTGTEFTGVDLAGKLRAEAGHTARLEMTNIAGSTKLLFGYGSSGLSGWAPYSWDAGSGSGYAAFWATVACAASPSCPLTGNGEHSKAYLRDLVFELNDLVAPTVTLGKELVAPGWRTGSSPLLVESSDSGGGLRVVVTLVNGETALPAEIFPCNVVPGTTAGRELAPCPATNQFTASLDTTAAPFTDGNNDLTVCALDYGGNANFGCAAETINVDNEAPALAFSNSQPTRDPELIGAAASDSTSGLNESTAEIEYRAESSTGWSELSTDVVNSTLQARVNSEAHTPGHYEFRATIKDVAGNQTTTREKADGSPMVLEFPLKESVSLKALLGNGADDQTVAYRKDGEVIGRLRNQSGEPIVGEAVTVIEGFAGGSLIEEQQREVTTDDEGRYAAILHGGPSRDVSVAYAGSKRYLAESEGELDFDVRGKAKLRTSKRRVRAGSRVRFLGIVRRHRAQIPPDGKLIEIQVKTGSGWTTLSEATGTDPRGRIESSHRFRGFYTQPVTFIFRLKVTPESGWPYRGPAASKRRRVTVIPKSR